MNATIHSNPMMQPGIDEETFAAWLDGTLTPGETEAFSRSLGSDEMLSAMLDDYDDITESYETLVEEGYDLPDELLEEFPLPDATSETFDIYGQDIPGHAVIFDDDEESDSEGMFDGDPDADGGIFDEEHPGMGYSPDEDEMTSYGYEASDDGLNEVPGEGDSPESGETDYRPWDDDREDTEFFDEADF